VPPDIAHLRATIEHLAAIERPSASEGERVAAEWIAGRMRELGLDARVEAERAHGTYWVPLGLMSAAAAAAGLAGRRAPAALIGSAAALGIAEDSSGGPHLFRRLLPHRSTYNVVAEAGDRDAPHTIVFVAHHDAAHGGAIFAPQLVEWVADAFPAWYARQETSPQVMRLVVAGPALVALGALVRARRLRRAGAMMALAATLAFADIAARRVVPGANDNLTGVAAVLELARLLAERPVRGVRVLLVSTGSEESFMEGMRAFARRHFAALPPESTEVVCLDCLGSPELIVIEGEGMLAMRDYPAETRGRMAAAAERAGVAIRRGLRLGLATDGLIALKAGYPSAALGSVTKYKFPSNYHSQRDVPENVDYDTVRDAVAVCHEFVASSSLARRTASSRVEISPA
jgi:acetylornithine deacetylase/succinyl-diaminopimelate desuccinylase-like protein